MYLPQKLKKYGLDCGKTKTYKNSPIKFFNNNNHITTLSQQNKYTVL